GGDNVTRYFHSLKRVWQDLDLFNTYKWRSTEDAKHHQKTVEEGRIFQFLAGLNEELDEVRGRIIGRATLPSLGSKSGPKAPRPFPTAHEAEKTSLSKEQVEQLIRLLNSSSLSGTPSGSLAQT
ncbi:hypothetical protein SESBI_50063, partial [Sesbania bispinosa]